jgi:CheY-like chemotaxis protein
MRSPEAQAGPVDILIVEDHELTRRSLRLLLEREGYTCAEASNGKDAVELARLRSPRCVLLDLAMPVLDGVTVARRLRADPRTCGVHIHCLTGFLDPATRQEARQAGCELFLTKPVDIAALLTVLRCQLDRSEKAASPPAGYYPCSPDTECLLFPGDVPPFRAVHIQELSPAGIRVTLDRAIPGGKVLTVELQNPAHRRSCRRQLRVVYRIKDPDGTVTLGGVFTQELSDGEMQGLR